MNKRYYTNENTTIDLEDVVGIVVLNRFRELGSDKTEIRYEVAFKSGTKLICHGDNLRSQFAEYKGITEEVETKE